MQSDGKRTIKITEKPRVTLTGTGPKSHVDLLTKVFIPIAPGQQELRVDCRILMTEPDGTLSGEPEHRRAASATLKGIKMLGVTWHQLETLTAESGVTVPTGIVALPT